jgi:hypothetical protein
MDKKALIQERSKTRLKKEIKKRIETTMIGALASVEKYFGHLWGHNALEVSPEQAQLKEIYEELRSEILDKGNAQIRNADSEIETYDVTWNKYHISIPIKRN